MRTIIFLVLLFCLIAFSSNISAPGSEPVYFFEGEYRACEAWFAVKNVQPVNEVEVEQKRDLYYNCLKHAALDFGVFD